MVTGEPLPVEVGPGDNVVGATVNVGGRLEVRATRVGSDTQLAQIARLVTEAQGGKAEVQRLADRISAVFVPIVIALSLLTLAAWLVIDGSPSAAFTAAVAVLIIACPCALGLATPTALLVGTGRGAQLGILIKGPQVLESTRRIDTVVLDKTGTVTTGQMTFASVHAVEEAADAEMLRLAGALEHASEHPIGRAVATRAAEAGPLPPVTEFENHGGRGVTGVVEDRELAAGRYSWLHDEWTLNAPNALRAAADSAEADGKTAVWFAVDGQILAVIVVSDTVKATSPAAIAELRDLGLTPVLLTGDNRRAANAVARQLGIEEVIAEVLPAEKLDHIKRLQSQRKVVAMVGDGSQRRRRAGSGRPGPGDGHRNRCRDRRLGPDAGARRSARGAGRHPAVPRDTAHDQGQSVLGIRLQRRRASAGRARAAQSSDRRCCNGVQFGLRRDQQPAAASVHAIPAERDRVKRPHS